MALGRFCNDLACGPVMEMEMNEHWKQYATDFNAMSDEQIETETRRAQDEIAELEDWVDAVASWKAAGKPRQVPA
jgi:hypothetical protein